MQSRPTERTEELFERALELAERLNPRAGDTAAERELAEALVDLRGSILNDEGRPDWLGQTHEFRSRVQVIHSAINVDAAGLARLKGRLRQHYLKIVPARAEAEDVQSALARAEDAPLPLDGDFFDDLGVYVQEKGRTAKNALEATTLAIVAGRLLGLIDPSRIPTQEARLLAMTLEQVVGECSDRLVRELRER